MSITELTDRKEKILASIIERYTATGEPVGSKVLCTYSAVAVSSATVRNEMAELTGMGYLEQPHTSAGRIPSDKGYRFYIDRLPKESQPSPKDMLRIRAGTDITEGNPVNILKQTAALLSEYTGCAALATTSFDENARIERVEIVPLGQKTAMLIVITNAGSLQTGICRSDAELSYETMQLFYNIAESAFVGERASVLTTARIQSLAASLGEKSIEMTPLLVSLASAAARAADTEVYISGQSNLMNFRELQQDAYDITELLRRREKILRIVRGALRKNAGVLIGDEIPYSEMKYASVIAAPYSVGTAEAGAVGVIGSTRTDYARFIPFVRYAAVVTGALLTEITDK